MEKEVMFIENGKKTGKKHSYSQEKTDLEKMKKWRNKVKKMEKADKNEKIFLRNKKEIDNFTNMKSWNKKYGEKAGKQKFFWKKQPIYL